MDNDSIFMKQNESIQDNGETSILEMPIVNQLSSTSSEE